MMVVPWACRSITLWGSVSDWAGDCFRLLSKTRRRNSLFLSVSKADVRLILCGANRCVSQHQLERSFERRHSDACLHLSARYFTVGSLFNPIMSFEKMNGSPHVLVAEDEDLVALVVAEMLEAAGFRVTVVQNGQKAIEADAADAADLLVTDMRMPVLEGEALIRCLRQRRTDLPIIVMTGYSEDLPDEEPGCLIILRKPFPLEALVHHVGSLLNRRST